MYELEGGIHEQHGEYDAYLAVWSADATSKTMLFNMYEQRVAPPTDAGDEHTTILEVLMSALSRHAAKHDVPLL